MEFVSKCIEYFGRLDLLDVTMTKKFYCGDHLVPSECFRGEVAVDILREIALVLDPVPEQARGAAHTVSLPRRSHTIPVLGLVTLPLAHM